MKRCIHKKMCITTTKKLMKPTFTNNLQIHSTSNKKMYHFLSYQKVELGQTTFSLGKPQFLVLGIT